MDGNHSNQSVFCDLFKNQIFNSSDGPKLEEKLKLGQGTEKFGKIQKNLHCLLGNGRDVILTIPEVVNELLIRNYPEVIDFDGKGRLVIFIPEWFLTKAIKCVDPSRSKQLKDYSEQVANSCPERKRYFDDLKKFYEGGHRMYRGEIPERNLYIALQTYFNSKDETVAVFHGVDILKMNLDKIKVNEKDFVIINATHKCIIVIEVKNNLGAGGSVAKSIKQLLEAKQDLEAWFATEGLENWKYIPIIYAEQIEIDINCPECEKYVIKGKHLA